MGVQRAQLAKEEKLQVLGPVQPQEKHSKNPRGLPGAMTLTLQGHWFHVTVSTFGFDEVSEGFL